MDFRPVSQSPSLTEGHCHLDSSGVLVYYVPVRGPPGPPGHDGTPGKEIQVVRSGPAMEPQLWNQLVQLLNRPPQIIQVAGIKGDKGDPGQKGEAIRGEKGEKGDPGAPGVVEHDFTMIRVRLNEPESITERPQAMIQRGTPVGSWGVSYESTPSKLINALVWYRNGGNYRVEVHGNVPIVNLQLLHDTGVEYITQTTSSYYLDLSPQIRIVPGVVLELTIRWKSGV
jgi:hypothetical protein